MRMQPVAVAAMAVLLGGMANQVDAQTNPITTGSISVKLDTVATMNTAQTGAPNWGANVGDSRLFVAGQSGQVMIVENGTLLSTPFLDAAAALPGEFIVPGSPFDERGFLGIAFHPDFDNAGSPGFGKVYTYTSENPGGSEGNAPDFAHPELGAGNGDHQSVVREWTVSAADPNLVDTASSRVLMRIRQPQNNHNGGALVFGPDNNLYVALGDGGGANDSSGGVGNTSDGHTNSPGGGVPHGNGQDITNIYGSIVRINPTIDDDPNSTLSANGQYRIPNDNPFVGATGVDEIFAYGQRNPFRISFDSGTGILYGADVGQSEREEINVIVNGGNYGWVVKEGTLDTPGIPSYTEPPDLIDPIGEYTHDDGLATIGGFVYRGTKIPELVGKYVFGDLGGPDGTLGRLFYMDVDDPGPNTIFEFPIDPLGDVLPDSQLHGFGEGSNGEIYALFRNGQVVELVPEPSGVALAALAALAVGWRFRRRPK